MARNWAICIGVKTYQYMTSLDFPDRDAEELAKLLKDKANFEKTYLFTDNSKPINDMSSEFPSKPNYTTIWRWIGRRFNRDRKPPLSMGDNLWFFFSGHGFEKQGKHYLLLSDSDTDFVEKTAICLDDIILHLRDYSGAGNVILLIDACRISGKGGFNLPEQQGIIQITSCTRGERAYEIEELKHGSFTYVLLESLQLQGENNCATVERLYYRLQNRVPELNRRYQKPRQTPYAVVEPPPKNHLFLLPNYIKPTREDIAILREKALNAEFIQQDLKLAEIIWRRLITLDTDEALTNLFRIQEKKKQPQSPPPSTEKLEERVSELKSVSQDRELTSSAQKEFSFEIIKVKSDGKVYNRETKTARYFTEYLGNGVTLDMIYIPGGTFMMGTGDEEIERLTEKFGDYFKRESPQHQVTIQPFLMSKYPITQRQWQAIAARTDLKVKEDLDPEPSSFKDNPQSFSFPSTRGNLDLPAYGQNPTYLDRPVEQINWDQAKEFSDRLSKLTRKEYRLPSEAEWEYACRANTKTPFYFGETITSDLANYRGTRIYADEPEGVYRKETTPVGMFPPNAFGLYDLHGNVWEWCADTWHDNYQGAPTDGSAWVHGENENDYLLRGGSWNYDPVNCRSADRYFFTRVVIHYDFGFRVACVGGRYL